MGGGGGLGSSTDEVGAPEVYSLGYGYGVSGFALNFGHHRRAKNEQSNAGKKVPDGAAYLKLDMGEVVGALKGDTTRGGKL